MAKTYILHRNNQEIKIQKEAEYFTAIVNDEELIYEVNQKSEVSNVKRVFNNVFKIKSSGKNCDALIDKLRAEYDTRLVFHHAYKPTGDASTRYYITDMVAVRFKSNTSNKKIESILQTCGLQFIKQYNNHKHSYLFKVTKSAGKKSCKSL